jgi:hypothetical protein
MSSNPSSLLGDRRLAIVLDVLGILLVLVGALYSHANPSQGAGGGVFWLGIIILVVALILFVLNMNQKS